MFARQIAVMKGQAWNVVETLKQADHGPLELTRRTRVCVWDDLVDIPVAIPLRVPSEEMSRRSKPRPRQSDEEEMDISVANASAPLPQHDLLNLGSPTSELPNPNRFDLSRGHSSADLGLIREDDPHAPATAGSVSYDHQSAADTAKEQLSNGASLPFRPGNERSRTRFSLDGLRRGMGPLSPPVKHKRTQSFSNRNNSSAFLYGGDDLEGDLGYSAAAGMEGNRRKVIVERLETVKSKNPVFTWC